ncbi:MAG TPA: choice-of-anchor J domain-containing protein [Puia sp.]|nr:choice-of-anchor J domain-containing protein [Puia sp.]
MKKLYIKLLCPFLLLILAFLLPDSGQGQILSWDLNSVTTAVPFVNAVGDAHLNTSSLTRGSGVTATSLSGAFSGSGWDVSSEALAISGNKYFQFTVNALSGFQVSLSSLDVWFRRSGTGPNTFQWQYSLDGFATAVDIGSNISYLLSTSGGDKQTQLDLSGIAALQNLPAGTTVTIRLYGWGATGGAGTFALGRPGAANSLAIGGTVSAVSGGGPSVTVGSGSLTTFTTIAGTASAPQTITVNGSGLTNDITVTPQAPWEISTDGGASYSSLPLTLAQSGGVVSNATVGIRISAAAAAGPVNQPLSFTSAGAATQTVNLTGTVGSGIVVDPLQTFSATTASTTEIDLAGTGNAGGNNIVVAYTTTSATGFGTPSGALIAGNTITGGGTVLYSGPSAGFSFPHTGLIPGTTYFYSAWSVDGANNYSAASAAQATTNNPPAANIVVNQVYGGGGNSGSFYKNDFIELYNNESVPVNLTGWSVQYTSAAGHGTWGVTALSGTVPAKSFYLIQEAAGTTQGGGTAPLPTPDLVPSSPLALALGAGKVIVSNSVVAQTGDNPSGATVIDKVGYGAGATGFETAEAGTPDNTTSVQRKVDGVDNNNNSTDFIIAAPIPRNSTYTTTPPKVISLNPPDQRTDVPSAVVPAIAFDKPIQKGSGNITVTANGVGTTIDVNAASVVIGANSIVTINTPLASATPYTIAVDAGAFQDVYGNLSAAITPWRFTTYDASIATVAPATFTFNTCSGNGLFQGGFTQYSVSGAQLWNCTAFGMDSVGPSGDTIHTSGVQMNGFANNTNNTNEDWLISPKLDLTGTAFPLLSFWSRNAFSGDPLQLKISTDYTGTGDPNAATWTDLNGKFPSEGSDVWKLSSNINLTAYKQASVYFAFVYKSTTQDGLRWTLDSIAVSNSLTPPDPTLTLNSNDLQFGYTANGSSSVKTLTVTGNDLTSDITLTTTGNFLVSTDNVNFATSATILQATANNIAQTIYVQFNPATVNNQFNETLSVVIDDSTAVVTLKGNSIDPTSTLSIVNWNLNWFGIADPTFGPVDKVLQEQNVGIILPTLKADLYALQEVVNEPALAAIVATMPHYAYVVGQYGSHANTAEANHYPLDQIQKLAFVYNTDKFSNIHADSLLSLFGNNNAADTSTVYYNDWSSGRYPYMLTADVTLSDNKGSTIKQQVRFINIHGKSNLDPVATSYMRRKHGATILDSLIQALYPADNVIVLGDYNDDLNQTITAGIAGGETSYSAFTITDASRYIFPTKPLSPAGQHSDVSFSSVIDNVIASTAMTPYYFPGSATVLSDVSSLVAKYGTTTTDHYPVLTQFSFSGVTPLPVKLLDFTADKVDDGVRLSWTTSEETNSKLFEVQRSNDGQHFLVIGTVAAKGNSSTASSYTFTDQQPLAGTNYYRLNEVDLDGKAAYSKVLKVDFSSQTTIRISPNPAHATVTIRVANARDAVNIQILDFSGRVMKQLITTAGTQDIPVDISKFARGIYTVKALSSIGSTTQKLLVQ